MNTESLNGRSGMGRWRHEYKYIIDRKQEAVLNLKAKGIMAKDPHALETGGYTIRSLYFDDLSNSCLYENLAGYDPRAKFRIRYYNENPELIFLEKKIKVRGMCRKESCRLTMEECRTLMAGLIPAIAEDMPAEKKELLTELELLGMRPRVIVTYERIPYIYPGGNVRVTFDRSISSSEEIERFITGQYAARPVLPCGQSILEVKWDEVLPLHIRETLNTGRLVWTAFSKYAMCRKYHL